MREQHDDFGALGPLKGAKLSFNITNLTNKRYASNFDSSVFAPDDAALTTKDTDSLLKNSNKLMVFVSRHMFVGKATFDKLADQVAVANGQSFTLNRKKRTLGEVAMTTVDLTATNGVVYVLDGKLPSK